MGALKKHAAGAVPDTLSRHFHVTKDDPLGDRDHYHLYCYYRNADANGSKGKFHRDWSVSHTEIATSADSEALANNRREVNIDLFRIQITDELHRDNACLVEEGRTLIRMPAVPQVS